MNDVGLQMFLGGLFTTLIMFYSFMAVFGEIIQHIAQVLKVAALINGFLLSLIFLQGQFNFKAILGLILVFCGGYLIKNNSI